MEQKTFQQKTEKEREIRTFYAGFLLLFAAILLCFSTQAIQEPLRFVIRLTAGLGTGFILAFLPGLFSINAQISKPPAKIILRCTGGFAALVMVWLFDPGWLSSVLKSIF